VERLTGVVFVIISAFLFSTNAIFARISYDAGANPGTFLFIRFIIASPIMLLIIAMQGFAFPSGKLLSMLILMGGISSGSFLCFYMAISFAPVNLIIIITYMYPVMVTLLSAVFLKQTITVPKISALLMTTIGILLAIGLDAGGYAFGIILGILAALFYSLYLLIGSILIKNSGALAASTVIILTSTGIFGIVFGFQGPQWPQNTHGWLAMVASAIISTVLGLITFYEGLKRIDTSNAAIISTFEVIITVVLAMVILGETITITKILGGLLVVLAVILLAKNEYEKDQVKLTNSISR
jgi:drug/metabolite transporter (DMT)-like permease